MPPKGWTPKKVPAVDRRSDIATQQAVLQAAGLTPARIAHLIKASFDTLEDQLNASMPRRILNEDGVTSVETQVPDNKNRVAAAKTLLDTSIKIGALKSARGGEVSAPKVEVSINLPAKEKDVTPNPAKKTSKS